MRLFLKLIFLVATINVFASCGSSEKADDILKLGGISSTGNKEDEDSKRSKQDSSSPLVPEETCKNPLDLSPRVYRNTALVNATECTNGRSSACIIEFKFESLSIFTAKYAEHSAEFPSITNAEYKTCEQNLVTSIHAHGQLKLSDDKKTITDEKLGHTFELVQ